MSFHIKLFGATEVDHMLDAGIAATRNMKPAMEAIAEDLMEVIDVNFSSQGRRGGGSWKKLATDTVNRKESKGELPLILIATSALRDSMTMRRDPNMDLKVTRSSVNLGSRLDYAEVHNVGGGNNIPARPFAVFIPSDVRRWSEICLEYLSGAMKTGKA